MSLSADLLSCRNVTWKERRLLLVLISNIKRRHRRYRDRRNRLQSLLLWRKIEWNKKGEKGKVDGSRRRRDSLFLKSTFFPPHPFPPNVAFKRREENIPWPFLLRRRPFLETMDRYHILHQLTIYVLHAAKAKASKQGRIRLELSFFPPPSLFFFVRVAS